MKILSTTLQSPKKLNANYIFALYIALIPIFVSLVGIVKFMPVNFFLLLFAVAYFLFLILKLRKLLQKRFATNLAKQLASLPTKTQKITLSEKQKLPHPAQKITHKTPNLFAQKFSVLLQKIKLHPIVFVLCLLILQMLLSSIINGFTNEFITYLAYGAIILCFASLSSRELLRVLSVFVCVISACCIMGYIDPTNTFMPGFNLLSYPLSLQFFNPNYSAETVATCAIIAMFLFLKSKSKPAKILLFISFVNFSLFLFLNGSFMSISAVFFVIMISFFILLKHHKSQAKWAIVFFFIMVSMSIFVDLVPALYSVRFTTKANYFVEILGAIDAQLGTNLLGFFNITNQHGIDIADIHGFDGWDRLELWKQAIIAIGDRPIFGYGAGSLGTFSRPHNSVFSFSLNFGIFAGLCYIAIVAILCVKFIKQKQKSLLQTALFLAIIVNVIVGMMGSFIAYSHLYSVMCLGGFLNKNVEIIPQK